MVASLGVALAVAFVAFDMSSRDVSVIALYLVISGSVSLVLGFGVAHLALRSGLGVRRKVAVAGAAGSIVALVNVLGTALLMFIEPHDLAVLIVLLLFALIISAFFSVAVSTGIAKSIEDLTKGARLLSEGDLTTRMPVSSDDEIGELASVLNKMSFELERAFRRQQELEQARKELVASVSHDLRTPLASIRAIVEAISDGVVTDTETLKRYCRTLKGEVEHFSTLIDDLFELSKLDSGTLELQLQPTTANDLVTSTLEGMEPHSIERGVSIRTTLGDDLAPVLADSHKIQRVMYNLIQNAIRHTPADGTITVKAQDIGGMVQIDVTDTGDGIPETDIDRVFERFYRGEKSRSRELGGSGLGLAIAKGIVEAHGGSIWVESYPGSGSQFSFSLPKVGGDHVIA